MSITRIALFKCDDLEEAKLLRDAKLPSAKLFDGQNGISIRDNSGIDPDLEGDKGGCVWAVVYEEAVDAG